MYEFNLLYHSGVVAKGGGCRCAAAIPHRAQRAEQQKVIGMYLLSTIF